MGSYLRESLRDGERIQYQAFVSLWSLLPGFIVGVVFLIGSVVSMGWVTVRVVGIDVGAMMSLLLALVGMVILVNTLSVYYTTELAITDRRVVAKKGWYGIGTMELLLYKVESVQVIQPVSHRIFNFGTVVVSGAGEQNAEITGISNPLRFRDHYNDAAERTTNLANQGTDTVE